MMFTALILFIPFLVTQAEPQEHPPLLQAERTDLVYRTAGAQERASGNILAVDSDHLLLDQAPSLLPFKDIGLGVIAKATIKTNEVICEYRGPVIRRKDLYHVGGGDKAFDVSGPDGLDYLILGENICAYINDCTTVLAQKYTLEEWQAMDETKYVSQRNCFDGFSYNAIATSIGSKIFILASRDIKAGEEIFFPYLWRYWKTQVRLNVESEGEREKGVLSTETPLSLEGYSIAPQDL